MNGPIVSNRVHPTLPITRKLSPAYWLTLITAFLMSAASLAGLFFQHTVYPGEELRRAFVGNDMVNLLLGLPILLGSAWLARRDRLAGLLFWPGALFYVLYNYLIYAAAMPLTALFWVSLALIVLSASAVTYLVTSMDGAAVREQLVGAVPEKLAGGVLAGLGILFFIRAAAQVLNILSRQLSPTNTEMAVLAADFVIMPFWVAGGVLLWRKQTLGYLTGAGLLFQGSMLFVGLLAAFILQPFLTADPFPLVDFAVVFAMGLVCFVPLGLFTRGLVKSAPTPS